ncbi:hypothetical protein [Paenibacillus harenae]|uniref:hypothetical protein n=1 Tax=Paenibacillus harenae TaxID=306543 RepID=UPI00040057D4|nr:hypothetical protein [Paenibacillus harenae]
MKKSDSASKIKEPAAAQARQRVTTQSNLTRSQEGIITLQRTAGNQAVAQLMKVAGPAQTPIQRVDSLMSMGAVSLDLAKGDAARADIVRKMIERYGLSKVRIVVLELEGAFASEDRAEMTMQFLEQPGTSLGLAAIADRKAGAQNEGYLKLLKLLLNAQAEAGSIALSAAQFDVICSHADEIGENKSHLKVVVSTVAKSDHLDDARKKLDQIKKFNFNEKLEQRVDTAVKKVADSDLQDTLYAIQSDETKQKNQTFDDQKEAASQVPKIKKEKSEFKKNKMLEEEQKKRAKPKQDEISLAAEKLREEAKGPSYQQVYGELKDKYAAYYQAVSFHPHAESVLTMASNSFNQAVKVMEIVMLGSEGEALVMKSSQPIDKLIDLRDTFTPGQIGHLLQLLNITGLTPFMTYKSYMTFLHTLFVQVPGARLLELAKCIGKFHAYCTNQAAVGHFVALVQGYTVDQIVKLLDAAPPCRIPDVNKMNLLVTLSVKANTADDLLAALKLCEKAEWDAARILQEQISWPNGANAAALELAIQSQMLTNVNKNNQFAKWINMLAVLLEKNYHTISYGNVTTLSGKLYTKELVCTVNGNGMNAATFVVHGHPGAGKAQVGSPNASDIHLKPEGGYNVLTRLKREQIPAYIWNDIGEARRKELTKD